MTKDEMIQALLNTANGDTMFDFASLQTATVEQLQDLLEMFEEA